MQFLFASGFVAVLGAASAQAPAARQNRILLAVEPARPLIEHRDELQLLNFDLKLQNDSGHTLRLSELSMEVFDAEGDLVSKKTINSNGLLPSIDLLVSHVVGPRQIVDIFNPFFSFSKSLPITKMKLEARFLIEDGPETAALNRHRLPQDYDLSASIMVLPVDFQPLARFQLPLHGRVLVWDGHDFFAHHRRIPIDAEQSKEAGIDGANPNRYAFDLVSIDEHGAMFHGDPFHKLNYYSYGRPIFSPASGVIVACRDDVPDNEFDGRHIRYPKLPPSENDDLGNYVLINHRNGEYTVLPHMKPGSLRVKVGEHVATGQILGEVGFSGDAIFPHLHFALISGRDIRRSEGIPAYFDVIRVLGSEKLRVRKTTLDTGDLVMNYQ